MPNWKRTVDIKGLIDPSQTADVVALQIRGRLIDAFDVPDFELAEILIDFGGVDTVEECDVVLVRLYDWADENRVWLGL